MFNLSVGDLPDRRRRQTRARKWDGSSPASDKKIFGILSHRDGRDKAMFLQRREIWPRRQGIVAILTLGCGLSA